MVAKRRFLFIAKDLSYGGAERALIDLLYALSLDSDNDISLFLYEHKGKWIDSIPRGVRVLEENKIYSLNLASFSKKVKSFCFKRVLVESLIKTLLGCFNDKKSRSWLSQVLRARYSWQYDKIEGEYDIACTFLGPFNALDYVNAKVKLGWLHTDHSHLISWKCLELKMYRKVDTIVHVGENALSSFLSLFPELESKSEIIENVINYNAIIEKSIIDPLAPSNCIKIVSIGRVVKQKGFNKIPHIAKSLAASKLNFKWIVVGDGPQMQELIQETKSMGISESVSFIGFDKNPYRYMKWAELCIQPSLYEGKSIAVREALLLGCQVLVPDFEKHPSHVNPNYKVFSSNDFVKAVVHYIVNSDVKKVMSDGCIYEEELTFKTLKALYEKVL